MVYEVTMFATSAAGVVIDFQQQASLDMTVLATKIEEAKIEVSFIVRFDCIEQFNVNVNVT